MKPRKIIVTLHALDRYQQRVDNVERETARTVIRNEVRHALIDGRRAKTEPGWLRRGSDHRRSAQRARFVWPADERCAYVVREEHGELVVLTVREAEHRAAA